MVVFVSTFSLTTCPFLFLYTTSVSATIKTLSVSKNTDYLIHLQRQQAYLINKIIGRHIDTLKCMQTDWGMNPIHNIYFVCLCWDHEIHQTVYASNPVHLIQGEQSSMGSFLWVQRVHPPVSKASTITHMVSRLKTAPVNIPVTQVDSLKSMDDSHGEEPF